MDAHRFDALLRRLSAAFPRRAGLGALLAGVALVRGVGGADACGLGAAACRGNGQCCSGRCLATGACACNRAVKCKQPANRCREAVCAAATGKCVVRDKAAKAPCASDGNPCINDICDGKGRCVHPRRADDAGCGVDGDGRCLDGRCIPRPQGCSPAGTACGGSAPPCCSERCEQDPSGGANRCGVGAPGARCLGDGDCHSGECVGYRCTERECATGDDGCQDSAKTCGNLGICLRRSQGGTRCGVTAQGTASCEERDCPSDAWCQERTGNPKAFCAKGGRPGAHPICLCAQDFCAVPR